MNTLVSSMSVPNKQEKKVLHLFVSSVTANVGIAMCYGC